MTRAREPGHGLGGRPRQKRKPNELVTLTLRMTAAQREAVSQAAKAAGFSVSGWVVHLAAHNAARLAKKGGE